MGFKVGQKVVYPNHGIGIIEGIEHKQIGTASTPAWAATYVESAPRSLDRGMEFLLQEMEPESATQLRLSAIPYYISPEILRVLEPSISTSKARERCTEFSKYSFIALNEDGLVMHEDVRHYLFSQWITPSIAPEFIKANIRLVEYFEHSAKEAIGIQLEALQLQRLFHMFGADLEEGFNEFEGLLQQAVSVNRFSACESLIKLVHKYDEVLKSEYVTRLIIYEGDIAAAQGQWELAEKLFKQRWIHTVSEPNRKRIISDYIAMIAAREYTADPLHTVKLLKESFYAEEGTVSPLRVSHKLGDDKRRGKSNRSAGGSIPFYTLRLAATNSVVLVPVANAGEVGLRSPISSGECEMLLKALSDDFNSAPGDWKDRFKEFSDKMRTGDIFAVADVLKHLTYLSHRKPLSFREQRMLERARYLVVSELASVARQPECNIESRVEAALARVCAKHGRSHTEDRDSQQTQTQQRGH